MNVNCMRINMMQHVERRHSTVTVFDVKKNDDDNVTAKKNEKKRRKTHIYTIIHIHTYDGKIRSIVTVLFGSSVLWPRTV